MCEYIYVVICTWVYMLADTLTNASTYRHQGCSPRIFLYHSLPSLLRQGLSLYLELTIVVRLVAPVISQIILSPSKPPKYRVTVVLATLVQSYLISSCLYNKKFVYWAISPKIHFVSCCFVISAYLLFSVLVNK